tara:strand:- start:504 stop:908 length:405 start_codon:yes stop_codon:yes gene_type:complete
MAELNEMSDAELAEWQAGWRDDTKHHILAEKEWASRLSARQLTHQFKLEERLAKVNRWWSVLVAVIGVSGVLAGVWLGVALDERRSTDILAPNDSGLPGVSSVPANDFEAGAYYIFQADGTFEKADVTKWEDLH